MANEWLNEALCRNKHIDFWFPPIDAPNASAYYDVARQVCERCPVWKDCLDYGREETFGMWGGLTPMERRVFTGGRGTIPPHGSTSRYRQGCSCKECEAAYGKSRTALDLSAIPDIGEELEDIDMIKRQVFNSLGEVVAERASHLRLTTD